MKKYKKLIVMVVILLFSFPFILIVKAYIKSEKQVAANNSLKQIGEALRFYAHENNGYFPPYDGLKGLNLLYKETGYSPQMYIFRFSDYIPAQAGASLKKENVAFVYRGRLTTNDVEMGNVDTALAWDKPNNHDKLGNVLFVDGHVKGYAGANWMEQAGIPKKWIEKSLLITE